MGEDGFDRVVRGRGARACRRSGAKASNLVLLGAFLKSKANSSLTRELVAKKEKYQSSIVEKLPATWKSTARLLEEEEPEKKVDRLQRIREAVVGVAVAHPNIPRTVDFV